MSSDNGSEPTINEKTSFTLVARFFAPGDEPQDPDTVKYWIVDRKSDTLIVDEVVIASPVSAQEIPVTAAENSILDDSNKFEPRRMIVQATWGASEGLTEEYDWRVRNVDQVT